MYELELVNPVNLEISCTYGARQFHWPNILTTNFREFHWQIFEFFCNAYI